MNFLTDNKLNLFQHGFCVPTPVRLHCWRWVISRLGPLIMVSVHITFLDFVIAFDSVSSGRLLLKLDHIGVRRDLLNRIRASLTIWQQRVVSNGYLSTWPHVISGVPQEYWDQFVSCMSLTLPTTLSHQSGFLRMTVPFIAWALTRLTVLPCKETSLDMYSWTPEWQLPSYFSVRKGNLHLK